MKHWDVTIEGRVRKTIRVEGVDEAEAVEVAHGLFTVASEEGVEEDYDQETVRCVAVGAGVD